MSVVDPLRRVEILEDRSNDPVETSRCICIAASSGYEVWLFALLNSIRQNGNLTDCDIVVFLLDEALKCRDICQEFGASTMSCHCLEKMAMWSKSVLYSVASVLPYERFICMDVDILVLKDISGLFDTFPDDETPFVSLGRDSIFLNRHLHRSRGSVSLREAWRVCYMGTSDDEMGLDQSIGDQHLVINDGVMVGNRKGMIALEKEIDHVYHLYPDQLNRVPKYRNQGFLNVALARLIEDGRIQYRELSEAYNLQTVAQWTQMIETPGGLLYHSREPVHIVHFAGVVGGGKSLLPRLREKYAPSEDHAYPLA